MIAYAELVRTAKPDSPEIEANLRSLLEKLNAVRGAWGRPMIITSGLRSWAEHARIYIKIGKKPPAHSAHLSGEAADIYDRDGQLAAYLLENLGLLEQLGLYLEEPSCTRGWIHLQSRAPSSKRRVFLP